MPIRASEIGNPSQLAKASSRDFEIPIHELLAVGFAVISNYLWHPKMLDRVRGLFLRRAPNQIQNARSGAGSNRPPTALSRSCFQKISCRTCTFPPAPKNRAGMNIEIKAAHGWPRPLVTNTLANRTSLFTLCLGTCLTSAAPLAVHNGAHRRCVTTASMALTFLESRLLCKQLLHC